MRILLVEDDLKIASFIKKGLDASGFTIDHVVDGVKAYDLARAEPYDAVIVDIMLPKMDGLTLIRRLRDDGVGTPMLILSARDAIDDRVRGRQTGGDDYLTNPFVFWELLARVQALIRRSGNTVEPTRFQAGDLSVDILTREVVRNGRKIELQPREYSLLEYLIRNKERVVSKTMIMEHVWNYNFDPQTNVVEARICRLRDKIDKGFDQKLIQTIRGVGYVLKEST